MQLSTIDQSLLLAAYFRGGSPDDCIWSSNSDQVVTLSLFYTGDISFDDCAERFSLRHYVRQLYDKRGLTKAVRSRYANLLLLIETHPDLIAGGGDLKKPADPTYTACRLSLAGQELARSYLPLFPQKPPFPNWPDKRTATNHAGG